MCVCICEVVCVLSGCGHKLFLSLVVSSDSQLLPCDEDLISGETDVLKQININ